jgi:dTMP kinase
MKPRFIVVEGLEGAGKTSVIQIIESFLKSQSVNVINTREPGGTPMSEAIRECVKHQWEEYVTQETELLLMYAARSQLVSNVIKPALENDTWVIGDRHNWSSIAYQGGGRKIALSSLTLLKQLTLGDFEPDFTIYLDVSPEVGLQRARGRGELDRIEQAGMSFFERARAMFISLVRESDKACLIDANQSMEKVHADVLLNLENWFFSIQAEK